MLQNAHKPGDGDFGVPPFTRLNVVPKQSPRATDCLGDRSEFFRGHIHLHTYGIVAAGTFSLALGFLQRTAALCRGSATRAETHEMTISDLLRSIFAPVTPQPKPPPRLDAGSEPALSHSLGALSPRQQGWVTIEEARQLFSRMDEQYAFGEMDDQGKATLASFAARHSSSLDIMPVEGRIYFTRNAD
jgi:hypothetical protein